MLAVTKFTSALAVLGLLAGPALAQDAAAPAQDTTAPETTAPAAEAAPADANSTGGLSMGEDPNATPQAGQTYIKEEIGDWALQCVKTEDGKDEPCQLYQLLRDDTDNPVAEIVLFRVSGAGQVAAGASVIAPLQTLLPSGVLLSVDDGQPKKYPFSVCSRVGCVARIGLTEAEVNAMKNGKQANIVIRPFSAPDVEVKLPASLIGFTAGFDKTSQMPIGNQ
ncbi:invasion associated locus B family protein [Pseudooceanicola spongiae]|uniref:Invasion associated locus B family protein n=1 Tax=Pseudooceanicola spongiae TaxID=2613965 RepID=A0A7L9WL48_9RHOB|nr:invasion associated locus B family protein [Pseudooceanicola spongiae]QOL80116.1 invasion associated locus B family protein [Pseudooceanicola spongiae]